MIPFSYYKVTWLLVYTLSPSCDLYFEVCIEPWSSSRTIDPIKGWQDGGWWIVLRELLDVGLGSTRVTDVSNLCRTRYESEVRSESTGT